MNEKMEQIKEMTEQEQIEEMISTLAASNNPFVDVPVEIMPQVAKALYNAGYRKIPEDSVVLSKEEWKQIKNSLYYSKEELEKKLQRERKETAKEILSDLLDLHNSVQDINQKTDFYCSIEQLIAEIEIKYDIEVEE